jgi:hypothetical protein
LEAVSAIFIYLSIMDELTFTTPFKNILRARIQGS